MALLDQEIANSAAQTELQPLEQNMDELREMYSAASPSSAAVNLRTTFRSRKLGRRSYRPSRATSTSSARKRRRRIWSSPF